jgi:hypothetical protein
MLRLNQPVPHVPGVLRRAPFWIASCSLLYLFFAWQVASSKPYWLDEFFTLMIAERPQPGQVIQALQAGKDSNPPVLYFLTRYTRQLFGQDHAATRIPPIATYWLASAGLYMFLRRRVSWQCALFGAAILYVTEARFFSTELRPYALMLGSGAMSLAIWQRLRDPGRQWPRYLLLLLTLVAGCSSHYFTVFIALPLGVGELIRSYRSRQIDYLFWASLLAGVATPLLYVDWLRAGYQNAAMKWHDNLTHFARPTWPVFVDYWKSEWNRFLPWIALGVVWQLWRRQRTALSAAFPPEERAVILVLILLPVVIFGVGYAFTGNFISRYALLACLGSAAGFAAWFWTFERGGVFYTVLAVVTLLVMGGRNYLHEQRRQPLTQVETMRLASGHTSEPVAIADPILFGKLSYYSPATLRDKLIYLTDPRGIRESSDPLPEAILPIQREWMNLNIKPYSTYAARNEPMLIVTTHEPMREWLPAYLQRDGYDLEPLEHSGEWTLYLAKPPAQQAGSGRSR